MYTVTFYSFKGGTGRSMALANVAVDLLRRGRTVLLVDFDLEAPGLDTFQMSFDRPINGGLVEMVTEYLCSTNEATPSVQDYLYRAHIDRVGTGQLWILPAGCQDYSYDSRFRSINWQNFYDNEGGFLFFEDLKVQLQQSVRPDYVLIDSRTGHTDIGGICTRQLPDAVVAMFYPNEQNIRGLAPVVQDIRSEESGPLKKKIDLHFVMGNVPDLDDDGDLVLSQAVSAASSTLSFTQLTSTIHHFNNWDMLSQKLMLVERPKSKIAAEYRQLASAIVGQNLEDRDGAILVLDRARGELQEEFGTGKDGQLEKKLEQIRAFHFRDVEVMRLFAKFRRRQRKTDEALELFEHVLNLDARDSESLVGRAELLVIERRVDEAVRDLAAFFALQYVPSFCFATAARLLMIADKSQLGIMLTSPAIPSIPAVVVLDLVSDLQRTRETCEYAILLLRSWSDRTQAEHEIGTITLMLSLSLIGSRRFSEAKREIDPTCDFDALGLVGSFNFAMAEWGLSGSVPRTLFAKVLTQIEEATDDDDINHVQCFSLVYWAVGDFERARNLLETVTRRFTAAPRPTFSGWSYLYRSPKEFVSDLDAMKTFFNTGIGAPAFIG